MLVMMALVAALAGCRDARSEDAAAGGVADKTAREKVYVDVRTPAEYAGGHVEGALNIPVEEIGTRWTELEPFRGDSLIVYCRSGRRSAQAIQVLEREGFEYLRNGGGLEAMRSGR